MKIRFITTDGGPYLVQWVTCSVYERDRNGDHVMHGVPGKDGYETRRLSSVYKITNIEGG